MLRFASLCFASCLSSPHLTPLHPQFQRKLVDFLKSDDGEVPGAVSFNDLPDDLKREVQELEGRMSEEISPLVTENNLTIQRLLEAGCGKEDNDEKLGER